MVGSQLFVVCMGGVGYAKVVVLITCLPTAPSLLLDLFAVAGLLCLLALLAAAVPCHFGSWLGWERRQSG